MQRINMKNRADCAMRQQRLFVPPFLEKKSYAHGTACSAELNALCTRAADALVTTFAAFSNTSADKMRNHAKNSAHRFYIGGLGVSTHPQRARCRTATRPAHKRATHAKMNQSFIEKKSQKWHTCRESLRVPVPQIQRARAQAAASYAD